MHPFCTHAPTDTYGAPMHPWTHDAPICTYGCTHGTHRINLFVLRNEKYVGDAILQKTFCTDFLTKKMKKNEGELPQYHVRNSHPAIVSAEVFELVQMEIESRRQFGSRYSGRGVFASRNVCADCGGFYGSKVWHSNDPYRTLIWRCNGKYEKVKRCTTPHVKEKTVKAGFVQVMARLLVRKQDVMEGC